MTHEEAIKRLGNLMLDLHSRTGKGDAFADIMHNEVQCIFTALAQESGADIIIRNHGCICPPTSEVTCKGPTCPRRGI